MSSSERLTPGQARDKHRKTFEQFWSAYPRHTHINEAANVWASLMEQGLDHVHVVRAARAFASRCGDDLKFVPGPHRWLQAGQYDDADLFQDENAAEVTWLRQQWQTANVKAVQDRYHRQMPKVYPPDDITDPDAVKFWYKEQARAWIASVHKEKFETCSQPTTSEPSRPSSELSSTTQASLFSSPV